MFAIHSLLNQSNSSSKIKFMNNLNKTFLPCHEETIVHAPYLSYRNGENSQIHCKITHKLTQGAMQETPTRSSKITMKRYCEMRNQKMNIVALTGV